MPYVIKNAGQAFFRTDSTLPYLLSSPNLASQQCIEIRCVDDRDLHVLAVRKVTLQGLQLYSNSRLCNHLVAEAGKSFDKHLNCWT